MAMADHLNAPPIARSSAWRFVIVLRRSSRALDFGSPYAAIRSRSARPAAMPSAKCDTSSPATSICSARRSAAGRGAVELAANERPLRVGRESEEIDVRKISAQE